MPDAINVEIPLRTYSVNHTEKLRARMRRKKSERLVTGMSMARHERPAPPVVVTLTRVGPRTLDGDNLQGAMKHVRDGVADWLRLDDGDPRIEWRYAQDRGAYAVRVLVEAAS